MSGANVEDLTVNYEEDGVLKVKELDKEVLTKGAWATVLFRYQDLVGEDEQYGPEKYSIRRYKKSNGVYRQFSKFNISSQEQARKIIKTLETWLNKED